MWTWIISCSKKAKIFIRNYHKKDNSENQNGHFDESHACSFSFHSSYRSLSALFMTLALSLSSFLVPIGKSNRPIDTRRKWWLQRRLSLSCHFLSLSRFSICLHRIQGEVSSFGLIKWMKEKVRTVRSPGSRSWVGMVRTPAHRCVPLILRLLLNRRDKRRQEECVERVREWITSESSEWIQVQPTRYSKSYHWV